MPQSCLQVSLPMRGTRGHATWATAQHRSTEPWATGTTHAIARRRSQCIVTLIITAWVSATLCSWAPAKSHRRAMAAYLREAQRRLCQMVLAGAVQRAGAGVGQHAGACRRLPGRMSSPLPFCAPPCDAPGCRREQPGRRDASRQWCPLDVKQARACGLQVGVAQHKLRLCASL